MGANLKDYARDQILPKMIGGETSTTEQFEQGNPQFDAQQATVQRLEAMPDFNGQAIDVLRNHLMGIRGNGSASQWAQQAMEASRSTTDRMLSGPGEDAGLPNLPGFMYLNHLFKRAKNKKKMQKRESMRPDGETDIYTDHMEALKTALQAIGVYSDRNPGGMPMDLKAAKKVWFGSEAPDNVQEAEWRTMIEMGDRNIDPKRIRKFVNYDGSTTWEILNEDKTVMSRFTMGEYAGKKVFTQGGYNKFAEVLKRAQGEMGPDRNGEFDSMRGMFAGG